MELKTKNATLATEVRKPCSFLVTINPSILAKVQRALLNLSPAILIRDPNGHLVNFFTPVTPEAQLKFYGKSNA